MNAYFSRELEKKVLEYLKIFPVVCITGPRQSGKSTLLKKLLSKKYKYITFDDFRNVNLFNDDPERFISNYNNHIIFDEIQKVPTLFHYLKRIVDENRGDYGRFVITGSAQFSLIEGITESLAGRIGMLSLLPFQFSEIIENKITPSEFLGCYPEIVVNNYNNSLIWYNAYIETYIEKDVRSLLNIGNLIDFRRFVSLLAASCAQIINLSNHANVLGVSVNTIKRWISVLEASYIIFRLPPFSTNLGKRLIKSHKIFFYDTGIVAALTGIQNKEMYEKGPLSGPLFVNYVISEIKKKLLHTGTPHQLFFYRTSNQNEIDLIVEIQNRKDVIEIKNSKTFKSQMVKTIEKFISPEDNGFLLYQGDELPYSDHIRIIPYQDYLKI